MRLPLLATLAACLLTAHSAHADFTVGNTGIAPVGSVFQLQLSVPYDGGASEHFDVYRNGSPLDGCMGLRQVEGAALPGQAVAPVVDNKPTCLIPATSPGWQMIDIIYPITPMHATRTQRFKLQVVDSALPATIAFYEGPEDISGPDMAIWVGPSVSGPQPEPEPGDAAFTPYVTNLVGSLRGDVDGTAFDCTYLPAYRVYACPSHATLGPHTITFRFDAPGYASTTRSADIVVRGPAGVIGAPDFIAVGPGEPIVIDGTISSFVPVVDGVVRVVDGDVPVAGCDGVAAVSGAIRCMVATPTPGWHRYALSVSAAYVTSNPAVVWAYVASDTPVPTEITFPNNPSIAGTLHRNDARTFTAYLRPFYPFGGPVNPFWPPQGFVTFAFDGVDYPPCAHMAAAGVVTCTRAQLREGAVKVTVRLDAAPAYASASKTNEVPVLHGPVVDFDSNYKADILWTHTSGKAALWLMNTEVQIGGGTLFESGTGWAPKLVGDLDGNDRADILFEHADGRTGVWLMNGATQVGGAILVGPGTGWSAKLLADFNGDAKRDILWEHTDGRVAIWMMDGTAQVGGGLILGPATGWHPLLTADFDGDGKADILWRHDDGSTAMWLMDGTTQRAGARLMQGATGWTPKFTADFDGDGRADILWTHVGGAVQAWLMNGTTTVDSAFIRAAGSTDVPVQVGHVFLDGRAGIYWQHADGSVTRTPMVGVAEARATIPTLPAGVGYTVLRAADFKAHGDSGLLAQKPDGTIVMWVDDRLVQLLPPGTGWVPLVLAD